MARRAATGRCTWAWPIDGVATIGAVALPGFDGGLVLRSDQPRALPQAPERLRLVVSRTRPAAEAIAVAEALDGELVGMGSAGAKAMAVVLGEAEIYLHSGGQYEWDSCAPVAVAAAHGLHCSRIDGSPLRYNQPDTYLPDLLICRPEWAGHGPEMARVRVGEKTLTNSVRPSGEKQAPGQFGRQAVRRAKA
jgi:3'(2'), 5'-bisphosphate nucleotidase